MSDFFTYDFPSEATANGELVISFKKLPMLPTATGKLLKNVVIPAVRENWV